MKATIRVEADPEGNVFVRHCGWCKPMRFLLVAHPCLRGIPVTTGICDVCKRKALLQAAGSVESRIVRDQQKRNPRLGKWAAMGTATRESEDLI